MEERETLKTAIIYFPIKRRSKKLRSFPDPFPKARFHFGMLSFSLNQCLGAFHAIFGQGGALMGSRGARNSNRQRSCDHLRTRYIAPRSFLREDSRATTTNYNAE